MDEEKKPKKKRVSIKDRQRQAADLAGLQLVRLKLSQMEYAVKYDFDGSSLVNIVDAEITRLCS